MPNPEIRLRLLQLGHQRSDGVQHQLRGQSPREEEEVEPEAARPPHIAEDPYAVVGDRNRRSDGLADEVGEHPGKLVDFLEKKKRWQKGRKWQNGEVTRRDA